MRHEEEDWNAEWENPDFNESPSPEGQPGKFSKVPLEKKAPKKTPPWRSSRVEAKKKEQPKEEQDHPGAASSAAEPPPQEPTEPGDSQPSIVVEETVAADRPQNQINNDEPAAPAGQEPAAEPEPQPALSAGATGSFG